MVQLPARAVAIGGRWTAVARARAVVSRPVLVSAAVTAAAILIATLLPHRLFDHIMATFRCGRPSEISWRGVESLCQGRRDCLRRHGRSDGKTDEGDSGGDSEISHLG